MRRLLCAFALLCTTVSTTFAGGGLPAILQQLQADGAQYARQIVGTARYEQVLDAIESGNADFIAQAPLFVGVTDASATLSLRYALSRALVIAPTNVLRLLPTYFDVADICTIPYIEAPLQVEQQHITQAIAALSTVDDPALAIPKAECLARYQQISTHTGTHRHAQRALILATICHGTTHASMVARPGAIAS